MAKNPDFIDIKTVEDVDSIVPIDFNGIESAFCNKRQKSTLSFRES